jgi:hypothetical protein
MDTNLLSHEKAQKCREKLTTDEHGFTRIFLDRITGIFEPQRSQGTQRGIPKILRYSFLNPEFFLNPKSRVDSC